MSGTSVPPASSETDLPAGWAVVYAPGDLTRSVASAPIGADGRFRVSGTAASGEVLVLVRPSRSGRLLPTWYGGERARVVEVSPYVSWQPGFPGDAVRAPAAPAPVDASSGPIDLADLTVGEGSRVSWDNRDAGGRLLPTYTVHGVSAETGAPATARHGVGGAPVGLLLEPGPQNVEVVVSPVTDSGRRSVSLDLPVGVSHRQLVWPTRFYPQQALSVGFDIRCSSAGDNDACRAAAAPARGDRVGVWLQFAHRPDDMRGVASYRWYRGKKPIPGADKKTYRIQRADVGKKVVVRVRLEKRGFPTETYRASRRVAEARATVRTSLPRLAPAGRFGTGRVKVRVRLSDGSLPRGTIQLDVAHRNAATLTRRLATWTLRKKDRGVLRSQLPDIGVDDFAYYVYFVPSRAKDSTNADVSGEIDH